MSVKAGVNAKSGVSENELDQARLGAWLSDNIPGFTSPFSLSKFSGGQSNPTYLIEAVSGKYVLRRKPFGDLLASAHAVDREFKLISALHPVGFATPYPYALCEDSGVIGAMFYIMQFLDGHTYWDGSLPNLAANERTNIYFQMVDTLSELHTIDPETVGLGQYGKAGNYFERQVNRWITQYRSAQTDEIASMESLIEWLPRTTPQQTRTSVVHGDYRIDNLVFAKSGADVLGVLDWELSTLGDPLADFTYFAMSWIMPHEGNSGLSGLDLKAIGIPSLDEIVARYCHNTHRDGLPDLNWYFAYNLFRLASIVQGVKKRALMGNASSEKATLMAQKIVPMADAAWGFSQKSSVRSL